MQSKLKERVRRTLKEIDDLIPSAKRHLMTEAQKCFGQARQEISAITRERDAASSQLASQAMALASNTSTIHALERDKQAIESVAKELRKKVADLNLRLERVTEFLDNQTRLMNGYLPCILSKTIRRLVTAGKIDDATIKQFYMMSDQIVGTVIGEENARTVRNLMNFADKNGHFKQTLVANN